MTEFNLRAVVRDVLAQSTEADPGVIAGQVMARIPKTAYKVALTQTLRLFVRQIMSESRNNGAAVRPISSAPSKGGRSVIGAMIRDAWQKRREDCIEGAGGWVRLKNATYDDLIHAAEFREDQARRNSARARMYRQFALAVSEAEVATFGDLPMEAQMQLLGGAA